MAHGHHDVFEAATRWLEQDPDDQTRAELSALLDDARAGSGAALADLHDRFDRRLSFGTAGLRGKIEAGANRMNRVVVAQAAAGLAAYLLAHARGAIPRIVVGYDGRTKSELFARDTVELMAGAGIEAILLPDALPTPVLAFAVRFLGASAGVMVTASHNPAADNGYKVYLGGDDEGSQIVPPVDAEIAAEITRIADTQLVPDLPRSADYTLATEAVVDAYVAETAALSSYEPGDRAPLTVVYTAMHGVGHKTFDRVIRAAGFPSPVSVVEQQEPDASFPTVSFPNPEEPGALDRAIETARSVSADLIIANDPDADRMSVAIPDDRHPGGYRQLSGNEVGWLLGWRAAERAAELPGEPRGTLACTIVSSPALRAVAEHYGLNFAETLTGFKWVSRVPGLVFGYEEAIGYLVNPNLVRDKDGISAALAFLLLASEAHARGETIADRLELFARTFGHFASDQLSIRVSDLTIIDSIMRALRHDPPTVLGGLPVVGIDDLAESRDQPTDAVRLHLDNGSRVMARPSGTEPKLKFYIDVVDGGSPAGGDDLDGLLRGIRSDLENYADRSS